MFESGKKVCGMKRTRCTTKHETEKNNARRRDTKIPSVCKRLQKN